MQNLKEKLKKLVGKTAGLKQTDVSIRKPIGQASQFGDYCFACFELAGKKKKKPQDIAVKITAKIKKQLPNEIADVKAVGGYVNFFLDRKLFLQQTIKKILTEENKYGSACVPKTKALIEHTSINPNASPHVGRIRNAIIGDILSRLLKFQGYKTEVHFYVNDVSKQIALMLLEFKGTESFDDLLNLYVRMSSALEQQPELQKEVFSILEKIEAKDKEIIARMNKLVSVCIEGQKRILGKLGIFYDSFDYESVYIGTTGKILKLLDKTKRLKKDIEGRYILNQGNMAWKFENEMKSPILVLTRSDGTGLYPLRDINYTIDKMKTAPVNIIVLGEDQKLYFKQLSASLELLGHSAPRVVHYSFVLLKTKKGSKKMSTRKGEIILLSDFIKEAIVKANKEIKKRGREKIIPKNVADAIGIGAVRYSIAKIEENKTVVFDWNEALNFEGNSGAYLQYSFARASNILKRLKKEKPEKQKPSYENLDEKEYVLSKKLSDFPDAADNTMEHLRPHLLCNYAYSLAQAFNDFYEVCPVVQAEKGVKARRALLVQSFKQVLANVLGIVGIPLLEAM